MAKNKEKMPSSQNKKSGYDVINKMHKKKSRRRFLSKMTPFSMMVACCAALCILLSSQLLLEQASKNKKDLRDTMVIDCPQLSEAGDAFLLYHDGEAVLIDTGLERDGQSLVKLINSYNITSLKAMILTHYDKDHIGGAAKIIENVDVEKIYMPVGDKDSEEYKNLMEAIEKKNVSQSLVGETSSFDAVGGTFTIYPPKAMSSENTKDYDNNLSLMTKVEFKGQNLLFAGDAETGRWTAFWETQYDGTQYDFVKIPHHGRDEKDNELMLTKFVPEDVLITSSKQEKEDKGLVNDLEDAGTNVWLTRKGDVQFKVNVFGINGIQ